MGSALDYCSLRAARDTFALPGGIQAAEVGV